MCAFGNNDVYPDAGFQLNQSLECWFTQLNKIKSVPFNQLWKQSETFTQIFSIIKKMPLKDLGWGFPSLQKYSALSLKKCA